MSTCGMCHRSDFSARVAVIVVWLPGMPVAWPLVPDVDDDYRICLHCSEALETLVRKAVAGCPACRGAGEWTRVRIVFEDGSGKQCDRAPIATA